MRCCGKTCNPCSAVISWKHSAVLSLDWPCYFIHTGLFLSQNKMPKTPNISLSIFIQEKLRKSVHLHFPLHIQDEGWIVLHAEALSSYSYLISAVFSFYPQYFQPGKWFMHTPETQAKRDKGWNAEAGGGWHFPLVVWGLFFGFFSLLLLHSSSDPIC